MVRSEFTKLSGTAVIDDKDLAKANISATIEAGSISTRIDKRDEHLRSPDFLDSAKFSSITFKSTEVKKAGEGKYKVTGNLTLHGVSKSVVLDVEAPATELKDPYGNVKRGAVATTTINRKDFGLSWNGVTEAGGIVVSDAVKLILNVQLQKLVTEEVAA